ncbi:Exportin 7 [Entophlyctis luteolus]|nr:Exportin 7 [Entophlyctis luteolus]
MRPLQSLSNCQQVLEMSRSPYAQLYDPFDPFATMHLKALIISHFQLFNVPQKIELRNFLLNYLGSRGVGLQLYVMTGLAELFGLVTKLGWFDSDEFQNSLVDASKFLQVRLSTCILSSHSSNFYLKASNEHRIVGILILASLVQEMNRMTTVLKNMTRHRKVGGFVKLSNPSKWITNSLVYLLTFWSKVVATVPPPPYSRAYEKLGEVSLRMTKSFAQSRIESVDSNDENAKELLTDDETTLTSVLELAATMARVNYKDAAEFIVGLFDGCAAQYNELFIASNTGNAVASPEFLRRLEYVECKLSWMVYYMGACVGARSPMQISEEQENLDGEIVSKILQLVNVDGNFVPRLREVLSETLFV